MNVQLLQEVQLQFSDRIAYAHLSAEYIVLEYSANWCTIIPQKAKMPSVGDQLLDYFPEFYGLQKSIEQELSSTSRLFRLERINLDDGPNVIAYFDFTFVPYGDEGEMIITIEDMTGFGRMEQSLVQERNELRLARRDLGILNEELKRLDRLKSVFFSMAAHDLRSPLMTVRGYSDLLAMMVRHSMEVEVQEQALDFLETITVQADWLDRIINNILYLNKI